MKKILFMAAAALALASCSSENDVNGGDVILNEGKTPVAFADPYLSGSRATVITSANFDKFGVYAYEQGTTAWDTYRTSNTVPNFFYNQKIEKSGDNWIYSPIKYWSNNIGAKHSLFAYAPYSANPSVVFSLANNGPAIRYTAGKDDYDLLWADAKIDQQKTDKAEKIQFNFKHALAQVAFEVSTFVNTVHEGTTHTTSLIDEHTSVIIRSIKFVGGNVPSQGLLCLKDGSWIYEGMEEGVYEFAPKTITLNKNTDVYKNDAGYVGVSKENMVLPTRENEKVNIQVVYDVVTVDNTNPKNNSTITNKITSTESFPLEKGKSYKFKLDLGLTSVKFEADVATWTDAADQNVDLPNNFTYPNLTYCTCPHYATAPATCTVGDYYYNTDSKKYFNCPTTDNNWEEISPVPTTIYYNPADGKYYSSYSGGTYTTEVTIGNNKYYVINGLLYKGNVPTT